ncbi:hypothetical protein BVY03_05865 [bacterium K02(2017)]|nr:hypothetical protein BVY03_05865 [bacterium K02(2017)]
MYGPEALKLRKCLAIKKDSTSCNAWAIWNGSRQLCFAHIGRAHGGVKNSSVQKKRVKRPPPCRCAAYQWPHRASGGKCRWPEPPLQIHPTKAGSHRQPRLRTWKELYERYLK